MSFCLYEVSSNYTLNIILRVFKNTLDNGIAIMHAVDAYHLSARQSEVTRTYEIDDNLVYRGFTGQ